MTTSSVTWSIQEESGGIRRFRLYIGGQELHLVYAPRTESDGWEVMISSIFPSHWEDPSYPTGFEILVNEEDFSSDFPLKDEIDYAFEGENFSEDQLAVIHKAIQEFFDRLPP